MADRGDVDTDDSTLGDVRDVVVSVLKGEFEFGAPMWIFIGILGAFLATRGITRFIRYRAAVGGKQSGPIKDITVGGVHIHHQVFGIVMMFVFGLLMVAINPLDVQLNVFAVCFGIGVGLAFDEFALWLHLDDVLESAGPHIDRCRGDRAGVDRVHPRPARPARPVRGERVRR